MKDKIVLITGGARGIGLAIAEGFAKSGATPIIWDLNEVDITQAVKTLKTQASKSEGMVVNITDEKAVEKAINEIYLKHKKIDVLVNNAGITADTLILKMGLDKWKSVIDVNLTGTFNVTQKISKKMLRQRFGSIVNISSVIGLMGNYGQANYAASKGGIISLTKTCAKEFGARGIRVNAIAPGFIRTEMTKNLPDDVVAKYSQQIPLKSLGSPKDVANLCLFLASDKSKYITGQVIQVDGGLLM